MNVRRRWADLEGAYGDLMAALWEESKIDPVLHRMMTGEIAYTGEAHNLPPVPGRLPDFRRFP